MLQEKGDVPPSQGGCWYCHRDTGELVNFREFDAVVHLQCVREAMAAAGGNPDQELKMIADEVLGSGEFPIIARIGPRRELSENRKSLNADFVRRAEMTLTAWSAALHKPQREPLGDELRSLLADLMLLCDRDKEDFDAALRMARMHFQAALDPDDHDENVAADLLAEEREKEKEQTKDDDD